MGFWSMLAWQICPALATGLPARVFPGAFLSGFTNRPDPSPSVSSPVPSPSEGGAQTFNPVVPSYMPVPVGENPMIVILRFVVGIAVVFFLLWVVARWMRRSGLGDYAGPGLRILARAPLTRASQVAVVEIGGRMFLVGAGESGVTPIAELYDTDQLSAELAPGIGETGNGDAATDSALQRLRTRFTGSGAGSGVGTSAGSGTVSPALGLPVSSSTALRQYAQNNVDSLSESTLHDEAQMDRLARQLAQEFGAPLSEFDSFNDLNSKKPNSNGNLIAGNSAAKRAFKNGGDVQ